MGNRRNVPFVIYGRDEKIHIQKVLFAVSLNQISQVGAKKILEICAIRCKPISKIKSSMEKEVR
jgi:hypothetical protein